jgi:UDP-N-acetylglucosamine--N-acetylmuramyl-(pentapeptide) pyrophosphoryl-undecaprenol N-acetylglucosamine transferase
MKKKKILITAGGTGGHLFPAQGLAQELFESEDPPSILFAGGGLKTSPYFDREQFRFHEIEAAPLPGKPYSQAIGRLFKIGKGFWQALSLLKDYQPDLVVGFGSYYTVPILLASRFLKIPYLLHEANSIPGKANRLFSQSALCTGLHFPAAAPFLKGPTCEVGMPLRSGYRLDQIAKEESLKHFGLTAEKPVLLVFGGSQGAQGINACMKKALSLWRNPFQIIHLTGTQQTADEYSHLYREAKWSACVKAFEKQMQFAWRAADFFYWKGRSLHSC